MQPTLLVHEIIAGLPWSPTFADIGASGELPEIWRKVAPLCNYIAFDPDSRDLYEERFSSFKKSFTINKAVTSLLSHDALPIYLTKSPYCSSTLKPAKDSLCEFLFAGLFAVEAIDTVPCINLAAALEQTGLKKIDWIKIDTQGTDLRIWRSIPAHLRKNVMVVDVEPGLIDAYEDEDLFVDTHRAIVEEGFWLSNLQVGATVRMRPATLRKLSPESATALERLQRPTPAWTEARYIRSLAWIDDSLADQPCYQQLVAFALMDGQYGFALDVVDSYRLKFPDDDWGVTAWEKIQAWLLACDRSRRRPSLNSLVLRAKAIARHILRPA